MQRRPAVTFIFITLFLDIFGIGLIVPILTDLVKSLQGGDVEASSHILGWLGALYALMQFIFSPVLGSLSDRFGRRPVILLSLLGSGLDYLLLAWAPNLWWLFIGRIIAGISASNYTAASAYIADVTPPEKRAAGFGMIGAAFGLGFTAGPVIGGFLGHYGLKVPFIAAAIVTLLNWLYGVFVLPESLSVENRRPFQWKSAHPIKAIKELSRWPLVFRLAGTHFLVNMAHNIYPSLWVLYTGERYGWKSLEVGLSLGVVGVMASIIQGGLASRILKITGERRGVLWGLALMTLGMAAYGFATESWMIYAIIVLASVGSVATPAAMAIITRSVPADEQGAVQGALNSVASVAGIVGPLIWTSIFAFSISTKGGWHLPGMAFVIAALLTLLGLVMARKAFPKQPSAESVVQ